MIFHKKDKDTIYVDELQSVWILCCFQRYFFFVDELGYDTYTKTFCVCNTKHRNILSLHFGANNLVCLHPFQKRSHNNTICWKREMMICNLSLQRDILPRFCNYVKTKMFDRLISIRYCIYLLLQNERKFERSQIRSPL